MNINQILSAPGLAASRLSNKRKMDTVTSEAQSEFPSPPATRRRLNPATSRSASSRKGKLSESKGRSVEDILNPAFQLEASPLSFEDVGGKTVRALDLNPSSASKTSQSRPIAKHRNISARRSSIFSSTKLKAPLERHLRVLSRHIQHYQISIASNPVGAPSSDSETAISLTRIPSIMDVYLDAKSPSIDFTEEVLLEIADRSRRLSLLSSEGSQSYESPRQLLSVNSDPYLFSSLYSEDLEDLNLSWEQRVWSGRNGSHSGNYTRHPDSFERSTAAWSEDLNDQ